MDPDRPCAAYAAAVIDLFSRRVVGWSMSDTMTAQLVTDALVMAIWRRGKPDALLRHSDQPDPQHVIQRSFRAPQLRTFIHVCPTPRPAMAEMARSGTFLPFPVETAGGSYWYELTGGLTSG